MTLKLNLIFIAMDLLTLLVYPVFFVYGKLLQSIKQQKKENYAYPNNQLR